MLACVQQYCWTVGLVLACVQQYCRTAGLVLACVQQYCWTAGIVLACSIVSVLVLACVQQYLVWCLFVFRSIWSSAGLSSVIQ